MSEMSKDHSRTGDGACGEPESSNGSNSPVVVDGQVEGEGSGNDSSGDFAVIGIGGDSWKGFLSACLMGNIFLVKQICKANPDLDLNTLCDDTYGRTGLHLACKYGKQDVVRFLLQQKGCDLNVKDYDGFTALHYSCSSKSDDIANQLTNLLLNQDAAARANVNAQDNNGRTPLHLAINVGNFETVKALLSHSANPALKDDKDKTTFHLACEKNGVDVLKQLLKHSSECIDDKNFADLTALHIAVENEYTGCVQELMKFKADPNIRTTHGHTEKQDMVQGATVLHTATFKGNAEIVEELLRCKADPDLKCSMNFGSDDKSTRQTSPLHIAARKGYVNCLKLLLQFDANPNTLDAKGQTPLFSAFSSLSKDRFTVAFELLSYGTDITIKDNHGSFAFDGYGRDLPPLVWCNYGTGQKEFIGINLKHLKDFLREHVVVKFIFINVDNQHCDNVPIYNNCSDVVFINCSLRIFSNLQSVKNLYIHKTHLSLNEKVETKQINSEIFAIVSSLYDDLAEMKFANIKSFIMCDTLYSSLPKSLETASQLQQLILPRNQLHEFLKRIPASLEALNVKSNQLKTLPPQIASLKNLHLFDFSDNFNLMFPPISMASESLQRTIEFMKKFLSETVENKTVKVVLVGEMGVGKSTLAKALAREGMFLTEDAAPLKTDGIDITEVKYKDVMFKIYDFAGDVDYMETHMLFLSGSTLYLCLYDLSKFTLDIENPLGRLETWLTNLYLKCPNALCIIIGTHADSNSITTEVREVIRNKVRTWMSKAAIEHKAAFVEKVEGCILCKQDQPQEVGDQVESLQLPHILGCIEMNCMEGLMRKFWEIETVVQLKNLMLTGSQHILQDLPPVPRKWTKLKESLLHFQSKKLHIGDVFAEGKSLGFDNMECVEMLKFLHATGEFVYYSTTEELRKLVVLDPQWLANEFSKLITYKGLSDEMADIVEMRQERIMLKMKAKKLGEVEESNILKLPTRDSNSAEVKLEEKLQKSENDVKELLQLLCGTNICIKASENDYIVPCKLPVGHPPSKRWSMYPAKGVNQITYQLLFSVIPIDFFSNLIVQIEKEKDNFVKSWEPLYYASVIVFNYAKLPSICDNHEDGEESIASERHPCDRDSKQTVPQEEVASHSAGGRNHDSKFEPHHVRIIISFPRKTLQITARGPFPCCVVSHVLKTIEELRRRCFPQLHVTQQLLCPQCVLEGKDTVLNLEQDEPVCPAGDNLFNWKNVLKGVYKSETTIDEHRHLLINELNNRVCPSMFVVLPINTDSLDFLNRFVYSYLKDGLAVHFLCESTDGFHFTGTEGFRLEKPKAFLAKFGSHMNRFLDLLTSSAQFVPDVWYLTGQDRKAGIVAKNTLEDVAFVLKKAFLNTMKRYPELSNQRGRLEDPVRVDQPLRSELIKFLNISENGDQLGGLYPLFHKGKYTWLCRSCYYRLKPKD